jgi:hypothetical protein
MSKLVYEIWRATQAAIEAPETALATLKRLREYAKTAWDDAWVATMAPKADRTWDASITFLGTDAQSGVAPMMFGRATEVLGFHTVIVPVSFAPQPGLIVPVVDDLLVSVQYDLHDVITNTQRDRTAPNPPQQFAQASALQVFLPRVIGLRLESAAPQMSFTWRWKQGPGVFVDSLVTISAFVRYLDGKD